MCYTEGQEFWWKNLIKMLCCIYVTHALSNLEAFLQQQRRDFIYVINNFFFFNSARVARDMWVLPSHTPSALIEMVCSIPSYTFEERLMN